MKVLPLQFTVLLFLAILMCCGISANALAHGTGVSYEESKDGYLIDVGHDEFIAALESTRFDFIVYPEDITTINGEVFTDVWVTFIKDKQLFFAGGVHKPVFGSTGFTFVFPEEGVYTASVRYQKDGETVVQTEFPITVIAPLEKEPTPVPYVLYVLIALASCVTGVTVGLFIPRKNK